LYLTALANYATTNWLKTTNPVLDYANAMVASQKTTVGSLENGWQQHISGVSGSVPPLAPAKLTGSLWAVGNSPVANCTNFSSSDQNTAANFVENVPPSGAGTSNRVLGYMCWGGGSQSNSAVRAYRASACE